jgi:ubiquinone/menaquinone biosynthesis C-methylase UbiE
LCVFISGNDMLNTYVQKQIRLLSPYIEPRGRLLDFGCGDLSLLIALRRILPKSALTGIDVMDTGIRERGITFRTYDGKNIPFNNTSFDTTIVYHVFHHCDDPKKALRDVMRVTKKQILMVEPVYRNALDLFFMKILDRLGNGWRNVAIAMPFMFQKQKTWERWVDESGWTVRHVQSAGVLPGWLPFGETKLFVIVPDSANVKVQ